MVGGLDSQEASFRRKLDAALEDEFHGRDSVEINCRQAKGSSVANLIGQSSATR